MSSGFDSCLKNTMSSKRPASKRPAAAKRMAKPAACPVEPGSDLESQSIKEESEFEDVSGIPVSAFGFSSFIVGFGEEGFHFHILN